MDTYRQRVAFHQAVGVIVKHVLITADTTSSRLSIVVKKAAVYRVALYHLVRIYRLFNYKAKGFERIFVVYSYADDGFQFGVGFQWRHFKRKCVALVPSHH